MMSHLILVYTVFPSGFTFGLNIFISENNIHGNYNIVIYINIIGLERKQYSLFGSSPNREVYLRRVFPTFEYDILVAWMKHLLKFYRNKFCRLLFWRLIVPRLLIN